MVTILVCLLGPLSGQPISSTVSIEKLMTEGHWKRARQLVDERLRDHPNDALALFLSSKVAASFGDLEKGLTLAQRAVSLEQHNASYLAQLAEMHARLADKVSLVKQISYVRQFHKEVDAALSINPKDVDVFLVHIMFLSKAPIYAGGDRKQAHRLAEQLVRLDPGWGYLIQARLAEQERDDARIESSLTKAMEADAASYLARYSLAKFYCCVSATRKLETSERTAREAIRFDPSQSGGYEILARVLVVEQRWGDLEAVLSQAEKNVPDDLSPYYYAANTLIEQGRDFKRAERFLKKYLSQEPEGRQPTASQGREPAGHRNA